MALQNALTLASTLVFRLISMYNSNLANPKKTVLTPRKLSIIILFIGIIFFAVIGYPLVQVFSGQWKLNQQLNVGYIESLDIFGTIIPLGEISIRFYSLCILFAMLAGYAMAVFLSKWHYVAGTVVDRLFIGLVIFGIVGARAFYVLFNWTVFETEPINALLIFRGGLAFYGMLIACLIYLWAYTSRFKFNIWEFLDFLAPSVLIGQVLGRFGNMFNYESYGPPTKLFWKMYIPDTANIYTDLNQQFFHPAFLYEIIPNFILLFVLLFFYKQLTLKRSGLVFAAYAAGYGTIRLFTEIFRLDALSLTINTLVIPVSQVASLIFILYGIYVYFIRKKVIYIKKTMAEY